MVRYPRQMHIPNPEDERYSVPVNIIDEPMLTWDDEEVITALAMYKPRTKLKAGDVVMLEYIPGHLRDTSTDYYKHLLPRCWKIRFVITWWAYDLMHTAERLGGRVKISEVRQMLERAAGRHQQYDYCRPMIYAHGYPHGQYPDTAAWLPEQCLRPLKYREANEQWPEIIDEAKSRYVGYNREKHPVPYALDLAPDNYRYGENIGRPFVPEELLVHTLVFDGFEEEMNIPIPVNGDRRKIDRPVDRDHDSFRKRFEEDDE